jgi:hypothetical protein
MMVIETTCTPVWPAPVRIKIGTGFSKQIQGPEEALFYLANRWPNTGGFEHEAAQLSCIRMLKRRGRCDDARNAFVAAALEADVLVL